MIILPGEHLCCKCRDIYINVFLKPATNAISQCVELCSLLPRVLCFHEQKKKKIKILFTSILLEFLSTGLFANKTLYLLKHKIGFARAVLFTFIILAWYVYTIYGYASLLNI